MKEPTLTRAENEVYELKGQTAFADGPGAADAALVVAAKSGDAWAFEMLRAALRAT